MTPTHPEMVSALAKPGKEILDSMTLGNFNLLREVTEEAIAVGTLLDTVKKQVIYNKVGGFKHFPSRIIPGVPLTAEQCDLLHMALGIFGEAAEVLESVHNYIFKEEPLDEINLIEESGDIEFYHEGLRQSLNISRDEVLAQNIAKLSVRYEGFQYSDQATQTRADKA